MARRAKLSKRDGGRNVSVGSGKLCRTLHAGITHIRRKDVKSGYYILRIKIGVKEDGKAVHRYEVPTTTGGQRVTRLELACEIAERRAKEIKEASGAGRDAFKESAQIDRSWTVKRSVQAFLDAKKLEGARSDTTRTYATDLNEFIAFMAARKVSACGALTLEHLHAFRDAAASKSRQVPASGKDAAKGQKIDSGQRRSAATVNKVFRSVKAWITWTQDASTEGHLKIAADRARRVLKNVKDDSVGGPRPYSDREARQLVEAAKAHDDAESLELRATEYVPFLLLTGARAGEAISVLWKNVHLDGNAPYIELEASGTKTRRKRFVTLAECPTLVTTLRAMKSRASGDLVFPFKDGHARALRKRLIGRYNAPSGTTWQRCRQSCASRLTNAKGLFGDAALAKVSARDGHSVPVLMKHYFKPMAVREDATTIEELYGCDDLFRELSAAVPTA